jgi:hypothetical protein
LFFSSFKPPIVYIQAQSTQLVIIPQSSDVAFFVSKRVVNDTSEIGGFDTVIVLLIGNKDCLENS